MDHRGRIVGTLVARLDQVGADALLYVHRRLLARARRRAAEAHTYDPDEFERPSPLVLFAHRWFVRFSNLRIPRGSGMAASLALIAGSIVYGIDRGAHWPEVKTELSEWRDAAANTAGFRINAVRLSGENRVSHGEIFEAAGIGETTSVLFFDPVAARAGLMKLPWIAEATVQKLYPDQIQIAIVERNAYALWQRNGQIAVIDPSGTVIVDYLDPRFRSLPLVVGKGADGRAREIIDTLAQFPSINDKVAAAVLVAESRWNLRLKNGTDIRLPEGDLNAALRRLLALDDRYKILSRDIASLDLRLPDRVTARLSDDVYAAREAAAKERLKQKRKANNA